MLGKRNKGKKVFVGLSGGVDSSVSAALLLREGYDVTGVFIKVWQPDFLPCTWKDDRRDAMRVSAHLGIPFITMDAEEAYRRAVVDYMVASYARGETPNPDVMCNKAIKFGVFAEEAMRLGVDFVATGHYARVEKMETSEGTAESFLLAGVDKAKDQSYFLWTLSAEQLSRALFPVGHLKKPEVRALAEKFGLPTAQKKDSQGLCFMGKLDMKDFLKHFMPAKEGVVLNEHGEAIGTHEGAVFYTIGQRHGFTVARQGVADAPRFVVTKDMEHNTITVSHTPITSSGARTRVILRDSNIRISPRTTLGKVSARVRYRQPLQVCTVEVGDGGHAVLHFETPQIVAVGQSAVVYDGDVCLGGGVIAG